METTIAVPRHELLQIAEAVAREKGIERDEVLEAMEQAVQKAGRSKYGHEHDIRAFIDRKSGEIKLQRFREVADPVENEITQISPTDAKRHGHEAKVGEFLIDDLPPIDFGRIAAQTPVWRLTCLKRSMSSGVLTSAWWPSNLSGWRM